jgi:hypothetical protein
MDLNRYSGYKLIAVGIMYTIAMHIVGANYSVDLPIDVLLINIKKPYLVIDISNQFKNIHEFKSIDDTKASTAHFIPVDEPQNDWSKMIIAQSAVALAEDCMKEIKATISAMDIRAEIILDSSYYKKPYTSRRLIAIYYNPHKQREEALLARYFSGIYGCSGFQYIIALKEGVSREDALQELEGFEAENTHIKIY